VLRDALGSGVEVTVGSNGEVLIDPPMPPQSALVLVP
jgi:hypothetical protein